MILWNQEVVISKDDMGGRYHWGMEVIDSLRVSECEFCVISRKIDGSRMIGDINHHPSVDLQVRV